MAKRRTIIEEDNVEGLNPQPETPAAVSTPLQMPEALEESDKSEKDLREFFESLGDNEARVKINKFDAASRLRFLGELDLESVSESLIQENWGEGRYKLVVFDAGKNYRGSKTILIGPGMKKNEPAPPPLQIPISPAPTDMITLQVEMMRQEMTLMRDLFKDALNKMGDGNQKSSVTELAEVMAIMKSVTAAPAGPSPMAVISEALPVVKQLIDLGSNGGASKGEGGWMGIVSDVIKEIPNVVKNINLRPAPMVQPGPGYNPVPYPDQPVPAPNPPAEISAPTPLPGLSPEQLAFLRNVALPLLKRQAKNRKDPSVFVDYVLETLDEDQSLAIAQLLDRSYEEIAVIDPELMSIVYRPWFEEFFGGLKDALSERGDSRGIEGNGNNAEPDAGSGTGSLPVEPENPAKGD